ncbi:MAG: hypothetical protein Q9169_002731 [Polycauliona sp. 2 TL-2023]
MEFKRDRSITIPQPNLDKNSLSARCDSHTERVIRKAANKPVNPSKEIMAGAMCLCDREHQGFDAQPMASSMPLWTGSRTEQLLWKHMPYLLTNLYWRARKQMAIFDVFCQLVEMDKLSARALSIPVRYSRSSDMTQTVGQILACFDKIADLENPPLRIAATFDIEEFEDAIHWFAVMICRSCDGLDELNDVITLIESSGKLGRLDRIALRNISEEHNEAVGKKMASRAEGKGKEKEKEKEMDITPLFVGDEMENATEETERMVFGLILPDGTGTDIHQLFDDANARLVEIENVFKAFFDMTDKDLAMMDEDKYEG